MKKTIKKGILALCALTALSTGTIGLTSVKSNNSGFATAITAEAAETTIVAKWDEYSLGLGLSATLDSKGLLTISGEGGMINWSNGGSPFYAKRSQIREVVIEDGVTSIGSAAFYKCSSMVKVTIPNSVKAIRANAFDSCDSLTRMYIPNSVSTIESYAFNNCSNFSLYCAASTAPSGWEKYWNRFNGYLYMYHAHNYKTYKSNNDATCTEDGTKTATCACGTQDTMTDTGSKLEHNYVDGVCKDCGKKENDGIFAVILNIINAILNIFKLIFKF